MEEMTAARVVEHRGAEMNKAHGNVRDTEHLLRQARCDGEPIDTLRQRIVATYLAELRGQLIERERALKQARDVHAQIRVDLDDIGRGVKSIEKHRAQREHDYRLERERCDQAGIEELWLLRRRRGMRPGWSTGGD